ncbi:Gfo/Idh/MocA family protein [Streptococcus pluranimalium]|uniref:Gfo/Idh/MocA family protein n=1 Tax=Streptococcus pluranimalium TaxID=82348 RepID=UPI0024153C76|nr:Gfo/Idh/MocA family oxidoreductase [Streptococcus pluranimalium]WFM79925.1 Gfo/Idh/MocA family oxidoreductase [Streptococcus pluranimalium]
MLKIGLVGIGGISQKAYLPYMRQLPNIEWHIFTRNKDVRQGVSALFGQSEIYESLESLLKAPLDGVFIHAATKAHFDIASQFLIKGLPVYMDKPLTEDYQSTQKLYQLAQEHNTFLMAGFNRRFAPRVSDLAKLDQKRRIIVEKNDVNRLGDFKFKLFDFFIHPLDTALYLLDEQISSAHFKVIKENALLSQVSVVLETEQSVAIVGMNLQSGSRREIMEIQTPVETYHLENLDDLTIFKETDLLKKQFGSWDTTLYKRGFETIIDTFLEAIQTKENPVSPESSLLSHWLCHQINQSNTLSGALNVTLPK